MSSVKSILHFITPLKNVSPFDVNMATDAGFDVIVPYIDVDLKEVAGLVQDAIFSRAPQNGAYTAILIGGREPILAMDMAEAAKQAMVPPKTATRRPASALPVARRCFSTPEIIPAAVVKAPDGSAMTDISKCGGTIACLAATAMSMARIGSRPPIRMAV